MDESLTEKMVRFAFQAGVESEQGQNFLEKACILAGNMDDVILEFKDSIRLGKLYTILGYSVKKCSIRSDLYVN